jgi:hypothetical protein
MHRRFFVVVLACFSVGQLTLRAQDFKVFNRDVQIHGFASQGFVYTNTNNWLTMNSNQGSAAFTDFGINASTNVNDKLRIGAQLYDRNLGQLGQYHPSLDWAVADYRFRGWLRFRGGKVKTTLGLYTDSQDLDFLHVFALLPQSIYPTDLRDATIAHLGRDGGRLAENRIAPQQHGILHVSVRRNEYAQAYRSADLQLLQRLRIIRLDSDNQLPVDIVTRPCIFDGDSR